MRYQDGRIKLTRSRKLDELLQGTAMQTEKQTQTQADNLLQDLLQDLLLQDQLTDIDLKQYDSIFQVNDLRARLARR